ncbi:helix-turn-helix domain-containing protein [Paenibacillus sp. chi10]|uniref:Helix-turn-helix domain-containing protein n=1 Tax=Paenibacillus suaedae TaxID=3077233 RepID=A0AAJ2N346_9BACL|nr:helix-turn-helix domain-containing protein [Paenibacillus sp. chi10]MDT8975480.1 helix-turn-helix domain-containing protein [Paenibacillus sp. chi10]
MRVGAYRMAQILSIGELIHSYRRNSGMTLAQLSETSGVHKGTISKIENEDVKRPEYTTLRPLVEALHIPLDTVVELYLSVDKRAEMRLHILQDVIQHSGSAELARTVGAKFLESPSDDSHSLVERLYSFTASVEHKEIRLALYQLIVDYSRDHGIMPFLAQGLLQVYLIERDDFTRLRTVYNGRKYIVEYAHFLSCEDRIILYYKLGIHALNLFLYQESIDLCLHVLQEADADNWYYINALGILRDSYFYLEDYDKSEYYSGQYEKYDYPHIKANSVLMGALLNAKRGNSSVAITQLSSFLETCNQNDAPLAINQLMRLYLHNNQFDEIEQLLAYPICPQTISMNNPNIISQLAEYYYHRAEYFIAVDDLDKGISDFLESALHYAKINDTEQEKECMNQIVHNHLQQNLDMPISTLAKLNTYYKRSAAKEHKLEGFM